MQMLELQQQVCDAEAVKDELRVQNDELTSKIEALEGVAGQAKLWRQSQVSCCISMNFFWCVACALCCCLLVKLWS